MTHTERTFTVGSYTVRIVADEDVESPAEWADTDGAFAVSAMRRYWTPDNPLNIRPADLPETREEFEEACAGDYWVFPVRAYVHGGVSLSLGSGGGCAFDSGFGGWVLVSRKYWTSEDNARAAAESVVETWNDYLSGNVYGYVIEEPDGAHVESCWGFFGDPGKSGVVEDARATAEACVAADERAAAAERAAGNDAGAPPDAGDSTGPDAGE